MNVRVVRGLLWLLGVGALLLPVLDDPPLQTGAYVQDVRRDSAVVAMMTATPVRLGLDWSESPDVRNQDFVAIKQISAGEAVRRHAWQLTGLQPGRSYQFTVRADGGSVDQGSFRTPSDDDREPVRFDVVGDSGAQPWWVWLQTSPLFYLPARWRWLPPQGRVARMGEQILDDQPDFVLHVGDVIYPWGHAGHYAPGFFRPFAAVLRRAPCYIVLGNHDTMDDDGRQALANFVLPVNEFTGDERMYSTVWGPVRVVVLDANPEGNGSRKLAPIGPDHPSVQFLRAELAQATEPWIVVASHFPIESASRQGDYPELIQHVLPLLREFGVSLYLSGHDHTYQRLGKDGDVPLVVSGGGGKSVYDVGPHADKRVALSEYNHCTVLVRGKVLTLRATDLEGKTLDTLELRQDQALADRVKRVNPARAQRIEKLLQ